MDGTQYYQEQQEPKIIAMTNMVTKNAILNYLYSPNLLGLLGWPTNVR